jgi:hypothetical protein
VEYSKLRNGVASDRGLVGSPRAQLSVRLVLDRKFSWYVRDKNGLVPLSAPAALQVKRYYNKGSVVVSAEANRPVRHP